jgi:hypothetical protein
MTIVKNPNDIVSELVDDYSSAFGDLLLGVVMYGSAVSHEYKPGISEITILLILKSDAIECVKRCLVVAQKWRKRKVAVPLFMTPASIESAAGFYPVEFLDIQTNHRVLMGEDYFSRLDIGGNSLRLQCQRDLRDVSAALRRRFVGGGGKDSAVRAVMRESMEKMLPVFKAILRLNNKSIPKIRSDLVMAVEDVCGMGASAFSAMLNLERGGRQPGHFRTLFEDYATAVDTLIERLDGSGCREGRT